MKKNAYVTFVMRNDSFIPGALVFAYALRQQETTADLICMITKDISEEARRSLEILYDDVITIDSFYVPHNDRQSRQDRPFLFTRFQALRLGPDGDLGYQYHKILIADADLLPLKYYDLIFEVPAPAGVINESKSYCMEYQDGKYIVPSSVYEEGTWIWHKHYQEFPLGTKIPKSITDRVLEDKNNMGVNAALYLFEPNRSIYDSIIGDTQSDEFKHHIAMFPWPEMQYITYKMSGKWRNLDLRYSSFNGYPILDVLWGIHYAGLKPWQKNHRSIKHFAQNEDYRLWYAVFKEMMLDYPNLQDNLKLEKLFQWITCLTQKESYQFQRQDLENVKHLFKG